MGLSSNQARFLSLTSRQIDMEQRIQQICQRRLRLSSELENVATSYNNSISNRKMFSASQTNNGIQNLTVKNLEALGYKVINAATKTEAARSMKNITQIPESAAISSGYTVIHNASELVTQMNTNPNGKYILEADIDMSQLGTLTNSVVTSPFTGTFDGNGYTLNNMKINTGGITGVDNIGFFSQISAGATVKNVAIENADVDATKSSNVGILAGYNAGIVENCYSTGNILGGAGDTGTTSAAAGGLVGTNDGGIDSSYSSADVEGNIAVGGLTGVNHNTISKSFATGDVIANKYYVGGLSGSNWGVANITQSYATGNVSASGNVGGLVGDFAGGGGTITNSYATGDVSGTGSGNVGGLIGAASNSTATNNYATGNVTGVGYVGGSLGYDAGAASLGPTNYYQNNRNTDGGGATNGIPPTGWNSTIWDSSTTLPTLKNTDLQGSIPSDKLEEGLRNGVYSLAKEADEFTQSPITLGGDKYEEVDWRTRPEIYDELYKGDDVDAENKYDKTIDEINSQDKKLQLEQTYIETEYKAVSSEKEAVKKILDTNATTSFKYFS